MPTGRPLFLGICAFATLGGILIAGLGPFHRPRNAVSWLDGKDGLHFGDNGTILSSRPITVPDSPEDGSCSLEIWLEPGVIGDANTFLAVYTPEEPTRISLHQYGSTFALRKGHTQTLSQNEPTAMYVDHIFQEGRAVFITLTSGPQGTAVYRDGILVQKASHLRLRGKDLTGQLVLGTSPVKPDSWAGELHGLAIYSQELTAAEVRMHYTTWIKDGHPEVTSREKPAAVYVFDEHAGSVVHDKAGSGADLYIPAQFVLVDQILLEPPWKEFSVTWGYWKNVLINIGGFVPLGFFVCAYLSVSRAGRRTGLSSILFGALVSLTIEFLQGYLPTRQSGLTDVITNTLGTAGGVLVYRWKASQTLLEYVLRQILFAF